MSLFDFGFDEWLTVGQGSPCPQGWFWFILSILILAFWGLVFLILLKVLEWYDVVSVAIE